MNIVESGTGYVSLGTEACFAGMGNRVTCVDIDAEKITLFNGLAKECNPQPHVEAA